MNDLYEFEKVISGLLRKNEFMKKSNPDAVEDKLVTYLKKDEKTNTVKIAPKFEEDGKGTIIASGLLGGESIVGVIIAMYYAYLIIA